MIDSLFVLTSSLLKLAETSTGRVILNQSAWKLILAQKSEEVTKLFNELGPRYNTRPGGYLRILKCGFRDGDNAPMALVELVEHRHQYKTDNDPDGNVAKHVVIHDGFLL